MQTGQAPVREWNTRRSEKARRLASFPADGKVIPTERAVEALEKLIAPGDRVVLEGNNQKQADFLSRTLAEVDPAKVHDLHMIMPSVGRSEHLDIFEKGIARKLDFSFSGPQSLRISQLLQDGQLEIGAIHTYIELYSRLYVDLSPNVALIAGYKADRKGNLYTGPSTEDTPALVEAAAFRDGIVIAQVNELVDDESDLPRVDIPASWVDYIVVADKPFFIEPLFTRDPRLIKQEHILMAMMAIKGIYAEHQVQSLNHGIGFNTAAIELLLPTYGEQLGLKGKICKHWTLNPHPTLIPAIESGWVESVHCFGGELGMEEYIRPRPDIFSTGSDGSMPNSPPKQCTRLLSAGGSVCGRYVYRRHLAGRRTGELLYRDARPSLRLRRRAQYGTRSARSPPRHARLAQYDHRAGPDAARQKAGGADGGNLPGRCEADLRRTARRRRGGESLGHAAGAGDDLRRRRDTRADRRGHRLSLSRRER